MEWAKALVALDTLHLDPEVVQGTAGVLFKQREDVAALTEPSRLLSAKDCPGMARPLGPQFVILWPNRRLDWRTNGVSRPRTQR